MVSRCPVCAAFAVFPSLDQRLGTSGDPGGDAPHRRRIKPILYFGQQLQCHENALRRVDVVPERLHLAIQQPGVDGAQPQWGDHVSDIDYNAEVANP